MKVLVCVFISGLCVFLFGCEKYLDGKTGNDIATLSTISDCQKLLDNTLNMNYWYSLDGECSSDNFWLYQWQYDAWGGADSKLHLYWWADDIFFSYETQNVWTTSYKAVGICNLVLETLPSARRSDGDQFDFNNAKGSALFFRGYCFEKLLALFSKGYNSATKDKDLGVVLRLSADFNMPDSRANVSESYQQAIADLTASVSLLPERPLTAERPSKQAAFGALSEIYLMMGNYQMAKQYADSCLRIGDDLLDYNEFDASSGLPFGLDHNKEVILYCAGDPRFIAAAGYYNIDSVLYRSYADNDLRKNLFFNADTDSTYSFKGTYSSNAYMYFTGIAIDEIYLNRAECSVRLGDVSAAMTDVNTLLAKRYKKGDFVPYEISDATEALNLVLDERRKELIFREFRWSDIKRLNITGANISLTHYINNIKYVLPANDNKFALPIPYREVQLSKLAQNPR